jgi:hypothetical protein
MRHRHEDKTDGQDFILRDFHRSSNQSLSVQGRLAAILDPHPPPEIGVAFLAMTLEPMQPL